MARSVSQFAQKKQHDRHCLFFYPRRCEFEGCDGVKTDLKKCSACSMVMYCCKDHQKKDWKIHKADCKVFKKLHLRAVFYEDEAMLKKYPLRTAQANPTTERPLCEICGKTYRQEDLIRTECCGNLVCDTAEQYQMFTYSREFCPRSHDRYTLCGYHSGNCREEIDWRECEECQSHSDQADTLWRGLNSYNFTPLLSKDVPKHALCETCVNCKKKFMSTFEGCTFQIGGKKCLHCSSAVLNG